MRTQSSRSGFTLTELLVVIAIIGILASISIPAVMMARNKANKIACVNNMRQMGVAITGHVADKGKYPPSLYSRPYRDSGGTTYEVTLNWSIAILDGMDQAPLSDRIKDNPGIVAHPLDPGCSGMVYPPADDSLAVHYEYFQFDKYVCPMDDQTAFSIPGGQIYHGMSYVANTGLADYRSASGQYGDPMGKGSGIFYDRRSVAALQQSDASVTSVQNVVMRPEDVYDGLAQTIMVAERSNPMTSVSRNYSSANNIRPTQWNGTSESTIGAVWRSTVPIDAFAWDGTSANIVKFGQYVNYDSTKVDPPFAATQLHFARPSSYHNGTVNVLWADGSVTSVDEDIDYDIYAQMMTSDSREITLGVRGAGTVKLGE